MSWGQGFAAKAAGELIAAGFSAAAWPSASRPTSAASRRVMMRNAFFIRSEDNRQEFTVKPVRSARARTSVFLVELEFLARKRCRRGNPLQHGLQLHFQQWR